MSTDKGKLHVLAMDLVEALATGDDTWLETADVTDSDLFDALDAGVSKLAIWRAMRSHGFPAGPNSAKRHLSGQCKCHS